MEHDFKKGDWFYAPDNNIYKYLNESAGSEFVCSVRYDGEPLFRSEKQKKIGALIESAPKLLSALEDILEEMHNPDYLFEMATEIESLITKAKGKQND